MTKDFKHIYSHCDWSRVDRHLSMKDGWCIVEVGGGIPTIQRNDEAKKFQCDDDAKKWVAEKAEAGDVTCQRALLYLARCLCDYQSNGYNRSIEVADALDTEEGWVARCLLLTVYRLEEEKKSGPTIYVASRVKHADMWRDIRRAGRRIISTWIDEAGVGQTVDFSNLWERCIREASLADVTIVYREDQQEILKGAYLEVGAALSADRSVFAVGFEGANFMKHPNVEFCGSIDDALKRIDLGVEVGEITPSA